jgi:hypothetical protein
MGGSNFPMSSTIAEFEVLCDSGLLAAAGDQPGPAQKHICGRIKGSMRASCIGGLLGTALQMAA